MAADASAPPVPERERYGPLVHRSVRHGAYVLIAAVVVFVLGMIITQVGYGPPTYSVTANYISDLGAVHCGPLAGHGTNGYVCSPWHDVFNAATVLLGVLLVVALLLIRSAFPARATRTIGLGLLILAAFGAMGVGFSPEDFDTTVHVASAGTAFILGNLALLVLGVAMFRDTRWDGFRAYTMLSGVVGLVAFVLFYTKTWGPLGVGGMERLVVAPLLLWAVVVGIHLARIPTYAPPGIRGTTT